MAGLTIFFVHGLEHLDVQGLIRDHLLEAAVFVLENSEAFGLADLHAAVLPFPGVSNFSISRHFVELEFRHEASRQVRADLQRTGISPLPDVFVARNGVPSEGVYVRVAAS